MLNRMWSDRRERNLRLSAPFGDGMFAVKADTEV